LTISQGKIAQLKNINSFLPKQPNSLFRELGEYEGKIYVTSIRQNHAGSKTNGKAGSGSEKIIPEPQH
jgi:hypothetical protein